MDHKNVTVEPIAATEAPADTGPEILPEAAEAPASLDSDPLQASQSGTTQVAEPAAIDPLMEAAQAHDENSGKDADPVASEAAMSPASEPGKGSIEVPPQAVTQTRPSAAEPAALQAAAPGAKNVKVAAVAPESDKVDIFDQWAHSKIEGRTEKAPHPLAAQHPDDFVVVCEAGCAVNPVEVVYQERRDARGPVNETPLKSGVVAGTSAIDCVGGCYDARHAYNAIEATWDPSKTVTESEWMTSVKKETGTVDDKNKADSSGRWYDRIN
ncbi:MAG: hypothetical protein KJ622_11575 [Alphaproteobacteria bacterium]|nr:hypothetical protein [Alphaproteobacteria bacterium]